MTYQRSIALPGEGADSPAVGDEAAAQQLAHRALPFGPRHVDELSQYDHKQKRKYCQSLKAPFQIFELNGNYPLLCTNGSRITS